MQAGDVIVFDLGAWFNRYTSDISQTIPVSGKFTKEQAEIYNVVLSAQKEGIKLMVPGNGIQKVQTAVEDALLQGLQKLGLVTDPASPWQRRLFIQHGFIHGIGLDV
jgi:Xaa-Pro aminopeptidase